MEDLERKILKLQNQKEKLQREKIKNKEAIKKVDEEIAEYEAMYRHQLLVMYLNNKEIDECYNELSGNEKKSFKKLLNIKQKLLVLKTKSDKAVKEAASIQIQINENYEYKRFLQREEDQIEYKIFDIDEELKALNNNQKVNKRRRVKW